MANQVTMYKAVDGILFDTLAKAQAHELVVNVGALYQSLLSAGDPDEIAAAYASASGAVIAAGAALAPAGD